jgi:hypothetical protein
MKLPESITSNFIHYNRQEILDKLKDYIVNISPYIFIINRVKILDYNIFHIIINKITDDEVSIIKSIFPDYTYYIECNPEKIDDLTKMGLHPFKFIHDNSNTYTLYIRDLDKVYGWICFKGTPIICEYSTSAGTCLRKEILPILPELDKYFKSDTLNVIINNIDRNRLIILIAKRLGYIGNCTKSARKLN